MEGRSEREEKEQKGRTSDLHDDTPLRKCSRRRECPQRTSVEQRYPPSRSGKGTMARRRSPGRMRGEEDEKISYQLQGG